MTAPPRFLPGEPLPPYSYVPGRFPHPHSDPNGHSYGRPPAPASRPDPDAWPSCVAYLRGIDLFNHGYYWEAHEAWESLWHACGRAGPLADFFKALIQLAVAGVKLREGRGDGARWHARRAEELLNALPAPEWFGLKVIALVDAARQVQRAEPPPAGRTLTPVEIVLPFRLEPFGLQPR